MVQRCATSGGKSVTSEPDCGLKFASASASAIVTSEDDRRGARQGSKATRGQPLRARSAAMDKVRRVAAVRVFLLIAVVVHCSKFLSSGAAAAGGVVVVESVDARVEPCDAYESCVQSLKQLAGREISPRALSHLESCLGRSVLECPLHPAAWFGLAAVSGAMGNATASHSLCRTGFRLSEDKRRPEPRRGHRAPLLSIVVAGRADAYRGDPMKRACVGLTSIAHNANAARVPTEVVFVDYNSPAGRSVAEVLSSCIRDIPNVGAFVTVRVVIVPLWMLQISAAMTADGEMLAFNEMVAKNAGIRRALGTYIISSNPEVIFPSALWSHFAARPAMFFRPDLLVVSDRRDSWADINIEHDVTHAGVRKLEGKLDAGVRVVWSHLDKDGSTLPRAKDLGLAPQRYFDAVQRALSNCPWQHAEIHSQGTGARLAATFSGVPSSASVHHTAAGDFILAHRAAWRKVRGFFDVWSVERAPVDSLTVVKMVFGLNMRQMVMRGQYAVWHYSDEPFNFKHSDELLDLGRHRISDVPATLNMFYFFKWIILQRNSTLAAVNSCTWGLCSPFSAVELPFTAERLFRCGSSSSEDACFKEPEELTRMCPRTARFPFRSVDYHLIPALQSLDAEMEVAAVLANFGCLLIQRNKCAYDPHFTNDSRVQLPSKPCCANVASVSATPRLHRDAAASYEDVAGVLACGP